MLMGAVVATVLYFILFGTTNLNGDTVLKTSNASHALTFVSEWKGALWYMANAVEQPVSRYYYYYCFAPSIHSTDYLDVSLGCKVFGEDTDYYENMYSTDASLNTEFLSLPTSSYSTGWK